MSLKHSPKLISSTHPILHLSHPTLQSFTWNTIIRALTQVQSTPPQSSSFPSHSPFSIFSLMRIHGVSPDSHTFPFLLQHISSFVTGKQLHAQILRFGFGAGDFVGTCTLNMYVWCGDHGLARKVFDEMEGRDLVAWNAMANGYVRLGMVGDARKLFDEMPEKNVVSWSCMINGYVRGGEHKEAIRVLREMLELGENGVRPNEFTMSCVVSACGGLAALAHGRSAHGYIEKCGMEVGVVLGTSLIDMYAKCGSIERAMTVFVMLGPEKDAMAWSVMISGLAMHGHGVECLDMFAKMLDQRVKPNDVTFLGVLCACAHCGLVDAGKMYFEMMSEKYYIPPLIQHYSCMIDLYSRAGLIERAWDVVKSMPMDPDVMIWGALLSGSGLHGDTKTCESALHELIELEPSNTGAYMLLANAYAKMGSWMDAGNVRNHLDARGLQKNPGISSVEIGGILHEFFMGDVSHPESWEIYQVLEDIMSRLGSHLTLRTQLRCCSTCEGGLAVFGV